jgi:hypothetical protein
VLGGLVIGVMMLSELSLLSSYSNTPPPGNRVFFFFFEDFNALCFFAGLLEADEFMLTLTVLVITF